jgi:hypothetical protein
MLVLSREQPPLAAQVLARFLIEKNKTLEIGFEYDTELGAQSRKRLFDKRKMAMGIAQALGVKTGQRELDIRQKKERRRTPCWMKLAPICIEEDPSTINMMLNELPSVRNKRNFRCSGKDASYDHIEQVRILLRLPSVLTRILDISSLLAIRHEKWPYLSACRNSNSKKQIFIRFCRKSNSCRTHFNNLSHNLLIQEMY